MPSVVTAQTDFSAGELDVEVKRDNKNALTMAGARQASNFRILNAKGMKNRPGRRALFQETVRVEEVLMAPGVTYYLAFPSGFLRVYDAIGTQVFSEVRPWSTTTAKNVIWAVYDKSIYITFAGMVPRVLTWDGATTWTTADFAVRTLASGQKQTPFYRLAPLGITLLPSALIGNITLTASSAYFVAGMVGTRLRWHDKQITITGFISSLVVNATINENLNTTGTLVVASVSTNTLTGAFNVGDIVEGFSSGARAYVEDAVFATFGAPPLQRWTLSVTIFTGPNFIANEAIIGPGGQGGLFTATAAGPFASAAWDEEVMNVYRGWPASVAVDQSRLIFANFPSVPGGIAWSELGLLTNFNVGALPTDPIFELVPGKRQVLYVVPGMDASEFIFCDTGLLYIPITPANPLKPGSIVFSTISEDECGQVQPRRAGEFIIYATGGLNQLMAVRIFGAYTRAYKTDSITELSAHLFDNIKAIAIMTASASFAERYIFIVNGDAAGTVVAGKYSLSKSNELEGTVGWTPWTGGASLGQVSWVSVRGSNILFCSNYFPNAIAGFGMVELLDDSRYLDASQLYNTQPTGLPIPVGKGPLWYMPNGSVNLMDGPLGTRMMGTYLVDVDGFIIPQGNGGEDLTSVNLVVGQTWTARLERFVPPVQDGQDVEQRMKKRRILRSEVYVKDSTGFLTQSLYSGQSGPLLPALGTAMRERRVSTWNQGEDPTQPPPLREQAYIFRPAGWSHDPRWVIVKDTPGPLTIIENTTEVTV